MATITGQRDSSTLPPADTPGENSAHPACDFACPDSYDAAQSARAAWRSLVPALAGTPHVRTSRDGGRRYPARYARPLPSEPPALPAVVPVYDSGSATGRMLALDLDAARGDADRQAAELGQLLARHGARYVADVSPGGVHLYVLFAAPLPWLELRDLCRALALRFPAVDPAPMASLGGQISPPGSRHKSGGWRLLAMPLAAALAVAGHPNGPDVWAALLTELAAELQALAGEAHRLEISAELDDAGVPWIPRLGGRRALGAELDRVARTGRWDRSRYAGRSEARMAVLASAAGRGWRLADVLDAVSSGAWQGLPGLYYRASEPGRMGRLLPAEWRKAAVLAAGSENVRGWLTSDGNHAPPADAGADEFGFIRQWVTGTACAAADPERVRAWGRRAVAIRQLLAAIGQAAMVSGSVVLEFGTRNLALHAGLSQRTVSRLLRFLYAEPDPLLDVISRGRMARADRFGLRIPDRYVGSVRWRRRRAGRIDGIHPAFLVLGGTAGLVHQVLDGSPARGADVARAARLSPSATAAALRVLAEHGLAEHSRDGWRRGPASLDDVATSTGAADLHRERAERYKHDRASWRARLAQYQGARHQPASERDGWWSLEDPAEYDFMAGLPAVAPADAPRGPPREARYAPRGHLPGGPSAVRG